MAIVSKAQAIQMVQPHACTVNVSKDICIFNMEHDPKVQPFATNMMSLLLSYDFHLSRQ